MISFFPSIGSPNKNLFFSFLLFFPLLTFGQSFQIDSTFNFVGYKGLQLLNSSDRAQGLTSSSNGNYFVFGTTTGDSTAYGFVLKYRPDARRSPDFYFQGGSTMHKFPNNVLAATEDPLGGLLLAGFKNSGQNTEMFIFRFKKDGLWDYDFGNNAALVPNAPSDATSPSDILVLPDSNILVVGDMLNAVGETDMYLYKCSAEGTTDSTFGKDGWQRPRFGSSSEIIWDVELDEKDRLLVSGTAYDGLFNSRMIVGRFDHAGEPDSTFGINGFNSVNTPAYDFGVKISQNAAGDIFLTGTTFDYVSEFIIGAFDKTGQPITSFGQNGIAIYPTLSMYGGLCRTSILDSKNNFILVGNSLYDHGNKLCVMRIDAKGTIDSSFALNGIYEYDTNIGNYFAKGVIENLDGSYTVTGDYQLGGVSDLFTLLLDSTGNPVSSFGTNGFIFENIGTSSTSIRTATPLADGGVLTSSTSQTNISSPPIYNGTITKLDKTGQADISFANNGTLWPNSNGESILVKNFFDLDTGEKLGVAVPDFDINGNYINLAKFDANGNQLMNFGTNGWQSFPYTSDYGLVHMLMQNDGTIYFLDKDFYATIKPPYGSADFGLFNLNIDFPSHNIPLLAGNPSAIDETNNTLFIPRDIDGGGFNYHYDALVKYDLSQNKVDENFGSDGLITSLDIFGQDSTYFKINNCILSQTGRVLIAMNNGQNPHLIALDKATGAIDVSFGQNGFAEIPLDTVGNAYITYVFEKKDGSLILAGSNKFRNIFYRQTLSADGKKRTDLTNDGLELIEYPYSYTSPVANTYFSDSLELWVGSMAGIFNSTVVVHKFTHADVTSSQLHIQPDIVPNPTLKIFPNPLFNLGKIWFDSPKNAPAKIQIFNLNGKLIQEQYTQLQKGSNQIPFKLSVHIASGTYVVVLSSENIIASSTIIKQ